MRPRKALLIATGPLLLALIYVAVSYVIASGVTSAERKELEEYPSAYGLEYEDVEFPSRGGDVSLSGWYLPGRVEDPTLIFVHGINSNRVGDDAVDLAARLVVEGYNVLMFDLRGHGESGGDRVSGGYFERNDALGALDFLLARGVPADRVGVISFSMGASAAILAAAEEPALRALVADSSYADVSDLIAFEVARSTPIPEGIAPLFMPGARTLARVLYGVRMGELVPVKAVTNLDYPVLIIHGDADTRIPLDHGRRIHQAAYQGSQIWIVPGVDHTDAFKTFPEEYVDRVTAYLDSRLVLD